MVVSLSSFVWCHFNTNTNNINLSHLHSPNCILFHFPSKPTKQMAAVTSAAAATVRTTLLQNRPLPVASSAPILLGLPGLGKKGGVRCSMEGKTNGEVESKSSSLGMGMGASLIAAACAATMSSPAMALVDERLSTEGTGLPFGLSNNLLGWILFGVFGFIWAFYIVYTSTLEEDEESGLSL